VIASGLQIVFSSLTVSGWQVRLYNHHGMCFVAEVYTADGVMP